MSNVFTQDMRQTIVASFRIRECKEDIIPLIGNLPSLRLVLAWPNITIRITPNAKHRNLSQMGDRKKIWVGVELDFEEIAAAARIPRSAVQDHVTEAQMNLWIYPDNTVNRFAFDLAKATIVKVAQTRQGEE